MAHIQTPPDAERPDREPSPHEGRGSWLSALYARSPWIVFALLTLTVAAVLLRWDEYESGRRVQETDNAYVHFDTVIMEAKVSGYVRKVAFTDFQEVRAGDILVALVDDDFRMAVRQAEAKKERAAATLGNLDVEIELQAAYVEQARAVMEIGRAHV